MFVPAEATILHADADSFFASVEQRDDPRLRGKPVIVGGGVVLACSYEAKAFGVRARWAGTARAAVPEGDRGRPAHGGLPVEASKAMLEVFDDTSPLVEEISIDEAFLDVRGMERFAGTPTEIAKRLRRRVREQVGLPVTVGVACTKFLAKVASAGRSRTACSWSRPAASSTSCTRSPVERLWGVGPVTADKLHRARDHDGRAGRELAEVQLVEMLGRAYGRHLHSLAHNYDPRRVRTAGGGARWDRSMRSAGARRSRRARSTLCWSRSSTGWPCRLRKARRACRTVTLRLRFDDFSRATRSHTLLESTFETRTILATARDLLGAAMPLIEERGVTLVGLSLANLDDDDTVQLALPLERRSVSALDNTVDELRERFGRRGDHARVPAQPPPPSLDAAAARLRR